MLMWPNHVRIFWRLSEGAFSFSSLSSPVQSSLSKDSLLIWFQLRALKSSLKDFFLSCLSFPFLSFLSSQELLKNQSPPFWPLFSSSSSLFRVTLVQNFFFFSFLSFLCVLQLFEQDLCFFLCLFLCHCTSLTSEDFCFLSFSFSSLSSFFAHSSENILPSIRFTGSACLPGNNQSHNFRCMYFSFSSLSQA